MSKSILRHGLKQTISFSLLFAAPLGLSSLLPSAILLAEESCDSRDYATFVAFAQSLDPQAEALGKKMLKCGNRDYRESSYAWMGFFYSMTSQKEKMKGLASSMPPEMNTAPKTQAQRAALLGDTQTLTDKVNQSVPGYIDDPWIVMSLARAQMQVEQFPAAFTNYNRVLRLRENQDAAEVELLFAYIWAGDKEAAQGKLAALKRYESTPYMRQSLLRAERLIGEGQNEGPEKPKRDWLSLGYIQERDNRGYAATGGRAVYTGVVDLEIEALQHENPLEEELENVAAVNIGKEWGEEHGLRLLTDIGYYSAGNENLTGKLGLESHVSEALELGVAAERKQVSAYERPPAGHRAGLMRDSIGWNLGWHERVEFAAALHREDSDSIFEDYKLEIKLGSLLDNDKESGFGFIVPVSYRNRPMASPDYRSYPHDLRVGLGIRMLLTDGSKYLVRAEAILDTINRDDYGATGSFQRLLGGRIETHMRYYFQKNYYNFFEGSAFAIEKMLGEKDEDKGSEFLVGIGVSQESH